MEFYNIRLSDVYKELSTSANGLKSKEAKARSLEIPVLSEEEMTQLIQSEG